MLAKIKRLFGKSVPIVPVVRLSGIIAANVSARRGLSLNSLSPVLDKAFAAKGAKAVALVINSPGGSPVQSAIIAGRIRYLAKKNNLPILAFVEDVAASGGYWLACSGDEIYVNGASVLGSIGVVSAGFGFDEAIAKLGVSRRVYTAGEKKVMLDPFQPEDPNDVTYLKELQKEIHDQFVEHVKSRRGAKLKAGDDVLFSGAFWTGAKAIELGLADQQGELRQILESRFGAKVKIKLFEPKKSFFGLSAGGVNWSDRLVAAAVDEAALRLEESALRSRLGL